MNAKNEGFGGLQKVHNEIPIEVDLGPDFKFHDIFFCPVSKEISQKDNNPMLLVCGHVMSK